MRAVLLSLLLAFSLLDGSAISVDLSSASPVENKGGFVSARDTWNVERP